MIGWGIDFSIGKYVSKEFLFFGNFQYNNSSVAYKLLYVL